MAPHARVVELADAHDSKCYGNVFYLLVINEIALNILLHMSYTSQLFRGISAMAEQHELMGGKLHIYKRENSRFWQCSAYLAGKNRRMTTKEESLSHAKEIAEDWFIELRGKTRAGVLKGGKSFREAVLYLLPAHGECRHLSDRQELSHELRDDREVLRRAYQDDA